MKVKCFDEQHEEDLTEAINLFIQTKKVIEIKYAVNAFMANEEQIYCFSALVLYEE